MLFMVLRFIHVLAGFAFLMTHGVSIYVSFQLNKEEDADRMKPLLDLSASAWPGMMLSLLVLLIAGITLGFITHTWGRGWLWLSLAILLGITIWMFRIGERAYQPLRRMLGMEWLIQGKPQPIEKQRPMSELKAQLAQTRPAEMAAIGLGGFALILYLMYFKPF